MNILKVEFYLQNRLKDVNTFQPQMRAFDHFAIIQPLDVFIDMCFSFFSVKKLLHLCWSWKCSISQTKRTILRADKNSAVDKRIALNRKCFWPSQVNLTVIISFILADNSHTAVEAQLSKAVADHKFLFVACVYVPSSLSNQFAVRQEYC